MNKTLKRNGVGGYEDRSSGTEDWAGPQDWPNSYREGGRETSRTRTALDEEVTMPIILWLLGVPLTLVLVLWFFGIVGF
jgi:hypothetical protein